MIDYKAKVEVFLGMKRIICSRCNCTLSDYADKCTATLNQTCPGFVTIEKARAEHETNS